MDSKERDYDPTGSDKDKKKKEREKEKEREREREKERNSSSLCMQAAVHKSSGGEEDFGVMYVGDWKLSREIGRGLCGVVWEAAHRTKRKKKVL